MNRAHPLIELAILFIIPITFIIMGATYINHPPNRNTISGYKTNMAKKNDDTWKTAHNIFGKVSIPVGCIQFIIAVCTADNLLNSEKIDFEYPVLLSTFIQLGLMFVSIIITEIILKTKFDENGDRK